MEKDATTLPEVWVITGRVLTGIDYDPERRILAICPDEENAQRGKAYYEEDYDDVEIDCWDQETFEEKPIVWKGTFEIEISPYAKSDKTYLINNARMNVEKKFLTKCEIPQKYDSFTFDIIKKINQDGKGTFAISGNFITPTEPPEDYFGLNIGNARKEWLINKINEKGIIKLVIPTFD